MRRVDGLSVAAEWSGAMMITPGLRSDVRDTMRRALRQPAYFLLMAVSIGIGAIGAGMIGGVAYLLAFKELPYRDPGQLAVIWDANSRLSLDRIGVTTARYLSLLEDADVFASAAAVTSCVPMSLSDGITSTELTCGMATHNVFDVLGVSVGGVGEGESLRSKWDGRAVLLGSGVSRTRFAAGETVVGRRLNLSGQGYDVVGVLPPGLEILNSGTDLWAPLELGPSARAYPVRYLTVIARLKPGVSFAAAQQRLDALGAATDANLLEAERGWRMRVTPIDEEVRRTMRPALRAASIGAVLLVALVGANAMFLGTARRLSRQREMAVRRALGAAPSDLSRLAWCETGLTLLLAMAIGASAYVYAVRAIDWLVAALPDAPRVSELAFRTPWVISLACLISFTLIAAAFVAINRPWRRAHGDPRLTTRDDSRDAREAPFWRMTMPIEAGIAVTFVALTALLVGSIDALGRIPLGFDPSQLLTARLLLPSPAFNQSRRVAFVDELVTRLEATRGVSSAAVVRGLPMTSPFGSRAEWFGTALGNSWETLVCRRQDDAAGLNLSTANLRLVTPDYFRTLRVPFVAGRPFAAGDYQTKASVAIVSASLARNLWGTPDAAGRMICTGTTVSNVEVIGVVGGVRDRRPDLEPLPAVYVVYPQQPLAMVAVALRATVPPASLSNELSSIVRAIDPRALLLDVKPMAARVDASFTKALILSRVFALFAGLSIGLAMVGAYGVAQADVARRRRELAIRLALGASAATTCWNVLRRACVLVGVGVVLGVWAAWMISQVLTSLLDGLTTVGWMVILAQAAAVVTTVMLASQAPALRQAFRTDPVDVLRTDGV
jgi:putative ABC transport system permease protein